MYNPHAEILERFEKVEALINCLIDKQSHEADTPSLLPITRRQAANYLHISLSTLDILIKSGELPVFNIGRQVRIKWSDLENYIATK